MAPLLLISLRRSIFPDDGADTAADDAKSEVMQQLMNSPMVQQMLPGRGWIMMNYDEFDDAHAFYLEK